MDLARHTTSSIPIDFFEYDVFISFRGEDTRKNFTDHLCKGLCDKEIKVYIDEKNLRKGVEISFTLLQAIQKSKMSLIIFSKKYAFSTWCLEELVHILKCREEKGQIVVPIFYGVDPSHVRKQDGSFADAFVAHQQRFKDCMEKLQEWKAALTRACNISGWDSRDRNESKLVEEIVEYVVSTVRPHTTADFEGLVGVNKRLEQIESLLCFGSPDVRVLGISGMAGKTALARVVYNRFSSQFEGCCFLKNVREESSRHGMAYLERKLISKLMGEEDIKRVKPFVNYRTRQRKVLIVLDAVADLEQLERLAGDHSWFGSGSRVIITTRDRHLLRQFAIDNIYEVEGLNFDEALELFRLHASKGRFYISGYAQLSQSVIRYAHGLSSALKVLGSFLYGRNTKEWESELNKLRCIPSTDIYDALKVSYLNLDDDDKEIFLQIACSLLYEGKDRDFVERKLEELGLFPRIGIQDLIDKSLISIKGDGEIHMHDLIPSMAWQIVLQSSKKHGRKYCSSTYKGIRAEGRYFGTSNIDYGELPQRRTVLGKRYHSCYDYPQKSLPRMISSHNLVELYMPSSKLKQYWNEVQDTSPSTVVRIFISYEGQWRRTRGCWSFDGQKAKGMTVSKHITYHELVEKLCRSLMVDRSQYYLVMRFLVDSAVPMAPVEIQNDEDVNFFIGESSSKGSARYPLCVTLIKKGIDQHVSVNSGHGSASRLLQWGYTLKSLFFSSQKQIT